MKRLALLGVMALGCGPSMQIGNPGWRQPSGKPPRPPFVFSPAGDPATRYNDASHDPAPDGLPARILDVIRDAATSSGKPVPVADARLSAAARDLAAAVYDDDTPPYEAVDFALAYHGIVEPLPHLITVPMQAGDDDAVVEDLKAKLPGVFSSEAVARVGVGMAPAASGGYAVVIALQESGVTTEPIPREIGLDASFSLRGQVLEPFSKPNVYVTGQGGAVSTLPVTRDGQAGFRAEIRCGVIAGTLKIEVLAEDHAHSPTVLANFPIFCGISAPRTLKVTPTSAEPVARDVGEIEKQLFALANADRAKNSLPPLVWSDRAASIARGHSAEMRDKHFVGHISPTTGSVGDRAKKGGVASALLLENVALAYDTREVEEGFMQSPAHRANLLSTQATHLGIGVAQGAEVGGRHELYVTQVYFRMNPTLDHAKAHANAVASLRRARKAAGSRNVEEDDYLDTIAGDYAAGWAKGRDRAELSAMAARRVDALKQFSAVTTLTLATPDLDEPVNDGKPEPQADVFGIGVAQGKDPDLGEGTLFVVIMLAERR